MRPLREGAAGARQGELRPVLSGTGTGTAEQAEGRSRAHHHLSEAEAEAEAGSEKRPRCPVSGGRTLKLCAICGRKVDDRLWRRQLRQHPDSTL